MAIAKKEDSFIKKPIYPGGPKAMKEFIYKALKYPKAALKNKVEGIVLVKYDIDHKGKVIDTKVAKSVGHGCDEEAERIVKLFKFEIPKSPRKLKLLFHQSAKIQFKLPKPEPKSQPKAQKVQTQTNLKYQFVAATKKKMPIKKEKKSYTYTINI